MSERSWGEDTPAQLGIQGYRSATGVVLRRKDTPTGDRLVYLVLREIGPVWASVPGGAKGSVRFGGATEPFVWGLFHLYRSPRRLHLREVDVKEHFWELRSCPGALRRGLAWDALLSRLLLPGHPCDEILPPFFWALSFLRSGAPEEVVEWRFLWKWLRAWGRAPDLERCASCGTPLEEGRWDLKEDGLQCAGCAPRSSGPDGWMAPPLLDALRRAVFLESREFLAWSPREIRSSWWHRVNGWLRRLLAQSG